MKQEGKELRWPLLLPLFPFLAPVYDLQKSVLVQEEIEEESLESTRRDGLSAASLNLRRADAGDDREPGKSVFFFPFSPSFFPVVLPPYGHRDARRGDETEHR